GNARVSHEREARVVEIVGVTGGAVGERGPGGRRAQRRADHRAQRRPALGAGHGAHAHGDRLGGAGEDDAERVEGGPADLGQGRVGTVAQRRLDHELGEASGVHGRTIAEALDGCKVAGPSGQSRPGGTAVPPTTNRRVLLRSRPVGEPTPSDFEIVDVPAPAPGDGEVLCRTIYLSLDPYMRGRMSDRKSYTPSVE